MSNKDLRARADQYARLHGIHITRRLGDGTDGMVWKTSRSSAVKALQYERNYHMELGCYRRLSEHDVKSVCGLAVPRLLGSDDESMVVEIEIVSPPCLIDFGKAYLDRQPDHSEEQMEYHREVQQELWGERYEDVQAILWKLEQIGIYYRDANPRNIMFADWDQVP